MRLRAPPIAEQSCLTMRDVEVTSSVSTESAARAGVRSVMAPGFMRG
jgi:hypothetical protein